MKNWVMRMPKHKVHKAQSQLSEVSAMQLVAIHCEPSDQFYGEYDHETDTLVLTNHWEELDSIRQTFVLLHELAHVNNTGSHDDAFYETLTVAIEAYRIPWSVAREMEQIYPSAWNDR